MMTAGEFCNRVVVFIGADERATEAAARMRAHHVGTVVVVEEREGRRYPVGMITDRDLVLALLAPGAPAADTLTARELARRKLVFAREAEPLSDVVRRMRAFGIRRIPIVDRDDVLQGIIAFDDVLGFVAEELGRLADLLSREQERERAEDEGPS